MRRKKRSKNIVEDEDKDDTLRIDKEEKKTKEHKKRRGTR